MHRTVLVCIMGGHLACLSLDAGAAIGADDPPHHAFAYAAPAQPADPDAARGAVLEATRSAVAPPAEAAGDARARGEPPDRRLLGLAGLALLALSVKRRSDDH